jgi:hypothetical protein
MKRIVELAELEVINDTISEGIVKALTPRITRRFGSYFSHCQICDTEIDETNPGKEIYHTEEGQRYCEVVCNTDFIDTDFQRLLKRMTNPSVKTFEL